MSTELIDTAEIARILGVSRAKLAPGCDYLRPWNRRATAQFWRQALHKPAPRRGWA